MGSVIRYQTDVKEGREIREKKRKRFAVELNKNREKGTIEEEKENWSNWL